MLKKYLFLFIISIIIYFTHAVITNQGLYGDGNGYYIYTQSIYFDNTLNSEKVYDYLSNFKGKKYIFSRIFWEPTRNPFSIGTGLVWLPSIFFISIIRVFFHLGGGRFDLIYELGPGITGLILIIAGLYFLEKYLLNFYSRKAVFWTILTTFFATSVFYYTGFEPALSHQPSFFIICFLLWWTFKFKNTKTNYLILGVLFGLMAMIRIADVILLIPFMWQGKPKIKNIWFILIGILIAYSPQLLNQLFASGNILLNPYFTKANGTWLFNPLHQLEYLFSPKRGLFLWSPILFLGLLGLIKSKSKIFLFTIVILWLVTSSWSAYLSAGFGQRLAFSAIPFFAYGLAYIYQKTNLKIIITVFLFFSLWNLLLLKNVYLHKDIFIQKNNLTINEFTKYMLLLK